tara:strand:+ start:184 stop:459 length:276 start_codon:yes stop_codon:yes gene_type:complete
MNLELPPDVVAAVRANRKVEAIKLLRQYSSENNRDIDLKAAKAIIDTYIAENPQLRRTRYTGQRSGFGRMLITGILALLFYGLYQLFVGGQ